MLRRTLIPALALLAATLVAVEPAFAQRGRDRDFFQGFPGSQWTQKEEPQQREVSLDSILRNLRQKYGGRHLDASKAGNRWIIPWMTEDGKRLTIEVDATNGRIISTR